MTTLDFEYVNDFIKLKDDLFKSLGNSNKCLNKYKKAYYYIDNLEKQNEELKEELEKYKETMKALKLLMNKV